MNGKTSGSNGRPTRDRERQEEWRARIPELRRLVEDVAPKMWDDAHARRAEVVPQQWVELVTAMQADVHAEASKRAMDSTDDGDATEDERRGYHWSFKIGRVADMLEYLARTIRDDLGFEEHEHSTLASMVLLNKAVLHLNLELQDGGSKDGREDRDENRYRVLEALKALTPRFDDVHMKRLRALQVAESSVKMTRIPTDVDLDDDVERFRGYDGIDLERHRDFMKHDQPALNGVLARSWLVEVDEAFEKLDPLMVLEEFGEARAQAGGGKADGGDGRVGPVRALARLAVTCGALGYAQRDDEDFDGAVDRARGNLLMARSRIRKELRAFPGHQLSPEDAEPSE